MKPALPTAPAAYGLEGPSAAITVDNATPAGLHLSPWKICPNKRGQLFTRNDRELNWRQVKIDKLTHEVAYYKRQYFGIKAEHLPVEQGRLFEETLAADMAAITEELAQLSETKPKGQAKRKPLPSEPRPTPPKVCVWQHEFRRQLS